MTKLATKLALVTGGCHRLGAALSGRLALAGWSLALHGRHDAIPDPALLEKLQASGCDWHGFIADLGQETDIAALIAQITAHFGVAPSLLINSASLFGQDDPNTMTLATLIEHFTVNTAAPLLLAREVAAQNDHSVIINILDQRIRHPAGDQVSYTLSKLALAQSTEMFARALAPKARVCAVAPGLVLPTDDYTPEQMAHLAAAMPLHLLPDPDDIADAVLYLSTARATTGQVIFVDGGAGLQSWDRDFVYLGTKDS